MHYLSMVHLDCMGSIILSELLHASANRVVLEYISIVLLRASWAADVMESASSRITILWRPVDYNSSGVLHKLRNQPKGDYVNDNLSSF